jgi:hypothetical protein
VTRDNIDAGPASRLHDLMMSDDSPLYRSDEVTGGNPPDDAVKVEGIVRNFAFHHDRLRALKPKVESVIREVVSDRFFKNKGGGASFLELCNDRHGEQWGEHPSMELLVVLATGLGLAGYCAPRELWSVLPGGMPYVWFADLHEKAAP